MRIRPDGAHDREGIDAGMFGKTAIFQRQRRAYDAVGQGFERPVAVFDAALAGRILRLVPDLRDERAVSVVDDGCWRGRGENGAVDEGLQRQAREADEDGKKSCCGRNPHPVANRLRRFVDNPPPQGGREQMVDVPRDFHRPITTRLPALAPITSALYISSASPGGCVNEPGICARVR